MGGRTVQLVVAITRVLSVNGRSAASSHCDNKWMSTAFVDS